jgi:hypothetical protein
MAQPSPTRASSPRGDTTPAFPRAEGHHRERGHTWENTYITKPEGYGEARRARLACAFVLLRL